VSELLSVGARPFALLPPCHVICLVLRALLFQDGNSVQPHELLNVRSLLVTKSVQKPVPYLLEQKAPLPSLVICPAIVQDKAVLRTPNAPQQTPYRQILSI
jgi:hypothetical protein